MSYLVKEIFLTIQGEGFQTGSPAVFCRFTGCNLWTGREEHRASAVCQFCDTDFVGTDGEGGGRFATADDLADAVDALHARGFRIAIETNGTLAPPEGIDWICMSPKAGADLVLTRGDELKLVFPQPLLPPDEVADLEFDHLFLQPMDGPARQANTAAAIAYCLAHPRWRLSVQTHKYLGIP